MKFDEVDGLVRKIREQKPLVLNITNDVTMDFVANGLLALGASPIMSQAIDELEELIRIASVVVINPGTLDERFIRLSTRAVAIANQLEKPVVLDPVGAGATRYRTDANMKLLREHRVSMIRGNASEILALSGEIALTRGVDSTADSARVIEEARQVSNTFSACVLMSGKTDVVVEDTRVGLCERGSALMPFVTGSGCLLSAVVAAFHAVEPDRFRAASGAALFYGVCGEMAASIASHPGSFKIAFLDALHSNLEKNFYEKN